jgi:hypothetical protein
MTTCIPRFTDHDPRMSPPPLSPSLDPVILGRSVRSKSLLTRSHDPKSTRPNARWTRVHAVVVPYPRASSRRSCRHFTHVSHHRERCPRPPRCVRARVSRSSLDRSRRRASSRGGRARIIHSFVSSRGGGDEGKGGEFFHACVNDLAVDARRVRGVMTMCARVCSFG